MTLVIDASLTMARYFEDESTPATDELLDRVVDADTNNYAWSGTLRLAERFSLTMYDAAYLELALRHHLPLATLDRELRSAAPALDIELLGTN